MKLEQQILIRATEMNSEQQLLIHKVRTTTIDQQGMKLDWQQ